MLECLISLAIFHYKIPEEIIGIARINVRSMIRSIDGYRPPCRHMFNMINDVDRMDRQGETVSKIEIYRRAWHDLCAFESFETLSGWGAGPH